MKYLIVLLFYVTLIFVSSKNAVAQCSAGGGPDIQPGLASNTDIYHLFDDQCLAQPGTNVTIIVEAMADLGCNSFDASHETSQWSGLPRQLQFML